MSLPNDNEGGLQQNLAQLEDEQLADDTIARARAFELARVDLIRHINELDLRRPFQHEGFLSTTSWLRDKCRMTARVAKSLVSAARSLRSMPGTRRAYESGELTFPAVQMLGIAAEAHPEDYRRDEAMLVSQARALSPRSLRHSLDYWRQAADKDAGAAAADRKFRRRKLFISETIDGMVRLDGDFDPEGGAVLIAAVRSLSERGALDIDDDRSAAQRRADALVDICGAHRDGGESASTGGAKPHLSVIVDLETLKGEAGKISEFEEGTVIDAETARRLACDAGVSRVIVNGKSTPLDVGRTTRTVPAALRRALVARDRGCTYDGCDRPSRWCDAHHIVHWAQGGDTSLNNLRLLCRRHHRMMHPERDEAEP